MNTNGAHGRSLCTNESQDGLTEARPRCPKGSIDRSTERASDVGRSIERTTERECRSRTESGLARARGYVPRRPSGIGVERLALRRFSSLDPTSGGENSSSDYASVVVDSTGKPGERRCGVRGASKSGDGGVVVIDGGAGGGGGGGGGRSSGVNFINFNVIINSEKRAKVQGVPLGPRRGGRPKVQDVRG